ncbi:MAG: ABC transporter permease [Defluviitaleaceae bacterium]|nr:ABC transporter permease [Defluviitaleaceae bacterium]
MYVIEHALLNLGKNKGRNILLGVITLAIITATVVAMGIFNTTRVVIEDTRAATMSAIRIQPIGRTQMTGSSQQESAITLEMHQYFAESLYITGADISDSGRGIEAVYYLIHPDMLGAFESDLRGRGLPDAYTVRTDDAAFASLVAPIENLQSLSVAFLIIILVMGAVIMVLVTAVSIRERKYEIGVLRAMGMKKKSVALGLWAEIIVITCICFIIGMGIGAALTQPVTDSILAGQSQAAGPTTLADRINNAPQTEAVTVDVSITFTTSLQIFAISIVLASVAGIISITRITKYEPIKILMERT